MAFTFDIALTADKDRVRLEIGDTDANGYFLHDETIAALLTREGTVGGAIVASIYAIIALLSQPNFKADWLQVDNESARKGYMALLADKQRLYGINVARITATAVYTYRADSDQTEAPTYEAEDE